MQAGLLNEMIAFYCSESKRDNLGGTSESWVKVFDKRAYVRFKSGARKEANGEIYNMTVNTIMIRICKEVNAKCGSSTTVKSTRFYLLITTGSNNRRL